MCIERHPGTVDASPERVRRCLASLPAVYGAATCAIDAPTLGMVAVAPVCKGSALYTLISFLPRPVPQNVGLQEGFHEELVCR